MMKLRGMHRAGWLFVVNAAAMTVCLAWLGASPRADDAPQESNVAAPETILMGGAPWVGVGGCAAAACHGGETDKPRGEYATWIARDPHSRAYSVLFGETSLQMAQQLAGGDATRATAPHEDRRCLACHAPTGPLTERTPQITGDGVGCEACHGAAEKWSTEHATIRWKELSPIEQSAKRRELGMTDMHDILTRAQQCTRCHVGDGEANVDHDLIAAGHPRMSFELGAFHDELPKHWPSEEERRREPAFEAKLWAVGQATSAAAHFELIAARAEQKHGIEFSNYDCYACHHELRAPSWRQADQVNRSSPGQLRAMTWYGPLDLFDPPYVDIGLPPLKSSRLTIPNGGLALDRMRTGTNSRTYAEGLRDWATDLNSFAGWNLATIEKAVGGIAANLPSDLDWDHAAQWYLALVALERARLDYHGSEPPSAHDEQVQTELQAMKAKLDFPAESDGVQLSSPRDFDPDAFRAAAERLKLLIAARPQLAGDGGAP